MLLEVDGLAVSYTTEAGSVRAVREATFQIGMGETLALVGETGSGKSSIALAVLGLLDVKNEIVAGSIRFDGTSLLDLEPAEWRKIRGRKIALVSQDPRASLNPVLTVEGHLLDALRAHDQLTGCVMRGRSLELLEEVGIPDPPSTVRRYPHELSGGMCQRVALALGICHNPQLLIADEPTSALDPTIQTQVLGLLTDLKRRHNLSILWITHDLPLAAEIADRVAVMYHGRLVELGLAEEVLLTPGHPYTAGLLASLPDPEGSSQSGPLKPIAGSPPSPGQDLPGCSFAPRCPLAEPRCTQELPPFVSLSESHCAACIKAK